MNPKRHIEKLDRKKKIETAVKAIRKLPPGQPEFGARVYPLVAGKLLVKQTVLRGTPPEYVVDEQRERHVSSGDDAAIASAVRDAIAGKLWR